MPQLPVRCPACAADLTVGRDLLNRPVACGACGKAFVPIADPGGREPDDLPPARPRRERAGPVFGILSLILGLGGLLSCCCGAVPLVMGAGALLTGLIGVRPGRDGRGLAVVGLLAGAAVLVIRVGMSALGVGPGTFDLFDF